MITSQNRISGGFMRIWILLGIIPLLAIWSVGAADAPITSNPIPEPIVKRGLAVEVKDLVRLLDTRELHPADQDVEPTTWARVSYVRDLPDGLCLAKTLSLFDFNRMRPCVPQSGCDITIA